MGAAFGTFGMGGVRKVVAPFEQEIGDGDQHATEEEEQRVGRLVPHSFEQFLR